MTPQEEHGEIRYRWLLEQRAKGALSVDILLADDWRTMDSYRPSKDYVWVKYGEVHPSCMIASRGWHEHSYWYGLHGSDPLPIAPIRWKPIDWSGHASVRAYADFIFPPPEPWKRPPEPEYEPAGTDARLTPEPVKLLRAMRDGGALREKVWGWISFSIQRAPGQAEEKITRRPVDRLRECAFIERIGTLPQGLPKRMMTFDWRITAAGHAWLAANITAP
jgi:hypothetical protein